MDHHDRHELEGRGCAAVDLALTTQIEGFRGPLIGAGHADSLVALCAPRDGYAYCIPDYLAKAW